MNDDPTERASADLAERVAAIAPPGGWADLVERTRDYPTVLRRIDQPTAVGILWHAYLMTALSVHRFFDAPLTEQQLPTRADFEGRPEVIAHRSSPPTTSIGGGRSPAVVH